MDLSALGRDLNQRVVVGFTITINDERERIDDSIAAASIAKGRRGSEICSIGERDGGAVKAAESL